MTWTVPCLASSSPAPPTGSAAPRARDPAFQDHLVDRLAAPEGRSRRQALNAGGECWFAEGRPIRCVDGGSSMFIGGIRALLLQSLHPLAMAAVAGHWGCRGDPWGRLQRTS